MKPLFQKTKMAQNNRKNKSDRERDMEGNLNGLEGKGDLWVTRKPSCGEEAGSWAWGSPRQWYPSFLCGYPGRGLVSAQHLISWSRLELSSHSTLPDQHWAARSEKEDCCSFFIYYEKLLELELGKRRPRVLQKLPPPARERGQELQRADQTAQIWDRS